MYPLFESIYIENGQIRNGLYHEFRFKNSYFEHFGDNPGYSLFDNLNLPELDSSLKYKLRIDYNKTGTYRTISEYLNKIPNTLRLLQDNTIDYSLKYGNRNHLNDLYNQRAGADDVLIIKNGHITDATYSNIIFTDGAKIVTPSTPLLHGTCRERLITENKIQKAEIRKDNLHQYNSFQLINALNDFNKNRWIDIQNIIVASYFE